MKTYLYLAGFILLLRVTLPAQVIEYVYSRGVFVCIRWMFDFTFGLLPVPAILLIFLYLFYKILKNIFFFFRIYKRASKLTLLKRFGSNIVKFAAMLVFWFMFLWGMNYGRIPVETQMSLEVKPLDCKELETEVKYAVATCDSLRNLVPKSDTVTALSAQNCKYPQALEYFMRKALIKTFLDNNFLTPGRVRCRTLPSGWLMKLEISGIYIPFSGEGHIDGGLHALEKPFCIAHEMTHGYGFGSEGDCNFFAWMACTRSDDYFVQYSGALEHLRYTLGEYKTCIGNEAYKAFRRTLPKGIILDINSIRENDQKYKPILEGATEVVNNTYLKTQGIGEGTKSYDRLVMMVAAFRKKH